MNTATHSDNIVIKPEILKKEIILTAQALEQEREKHLKKIQKNVVLPGFRKGHSPMSIIKKKYNDAAFYDVFENLLKQQTNEILSQQADKPLYYVYDFGTNTPIQDDHTDKNITLEFLNLPKVNIDIKEKEIELIKYQFTDEQKKKFSDIVILHNFLNETSADKLEDKKNLFLLRITVNFSIPSSSEETEADKFSKPIPRQFEINSFEFEAIKLQEVLPSTIEKDKTYSVDIDKWLSILENSETTNKLRLYGFLKYLKEKNASDVTLHIENIQLYPSLDAFLNIDKVRQVFNLDESTEIKMDLVYTKLYEFADDVAGYFSGLNNVRHGHSYINNLINIDIPDDFVQKVYDSYLSKEDKNYISTDLFKSEMIQTIKENLLANLFPHVYNQNRNIDEQFFNHVAKTHIVDEFIYSRHLHGMNTLISYLLYQLNTANDHTRKDLLKEYYQRDSVYSFSDNLAKDMKVNYKIENINATNLPHYLGITPDSFA